MSRHIVITSFGSVGDVYPYVGLALGLKSRGHRPVLAMPAFYREMVEREGLEFHPVRPNLDPHDREVVARIMHPTRGTEFIVRDLIVHSIRESYTDLAEAVRGADLVVTHPITFAGPIAAQKAGLPWVSTVLAPMSFFSAHDLPVFPPIPWSKKLERVPGAARALVAMAKRVTRDWCEPVQALRGDLGLPRSGDPIYEGQHSPHAALGLFSRVLASSQPDWPVSARITGAIPYNGPAGDRGLSDEVEAFLAAGPPPVVFTLGSSAVGAAGDFYEQSIEAVRRVRCRAILLVGAHAENRPQGPLPDGVMLVGFAPHSAIFPRASVIVHQGGAGTLHQALRSGRPTLVVPFAHDQPDNAYRVKRLGVSRTLAPARYGARRVAAELKILLANDTYAARAAEVGAEVRAENGVDAACAEMERVMG